MKNSKFSLVLSLLLVLALSNIVGCGKEADYKSKGEITGIDMRACACCGGYFIKIDTAVYLANILPADFKYDFSKATFPIPVMLDWSLSKFQCTTMKQIEVSRISLSQ